MFNCISVYIVHFLLSLLPGFDSHPSDLDMNTFYNKVYLPSVEDIAGRKPINRDLAGQKFPLE